MKDNTKLEQQYLKNDIKNLEEVIIKALLEYRQLTTLEYMQKLFNNDSTWTENNKFLVDELMKEIKDGNHSDIIIEIIESWKERVESGEKTIEYWKKKARRGEEDAAIHLKALTETSKEWNERKLKWAIENNEKMHDIKTKDLEDEVSASRKEIEEKSVLLDSINEKVQEKDAIIKKLQAELEEKTHLLDNVNNRLDEKEKELKKTKKDLENEESKTKNLTRKLSFAVKELPSLPKNKINLKKLGTKIKTSLQKLIKKEKMVARVEVRTK